MPEIRYHINVVAHRLFGTQYRLSRGGPLMASHDAFTGTIGPLVDAPLGPRRSVVTLPDYSHGTTRSVEEIQALFDSNPALEDNTGETVNDLWREVGIEFHLRGVQDHMIPTHLADYLPLRSNEFLTPLARQFNAPLAVNMYFVRRIGGADGLATIYVPHEKVLTFVFIADSASAWGADIRWFHTVKTVAHELGHVLGLPHMPVTANAMYNSAAAGLQLEPSQLPVLLHRARMLAVDPGRVADLRPYPGAEDILPLSKMMTEWTEPFIPDDFWP